MPDEQTSPRPFTEEDRERLRGFLGEPWDRETRIHDADKSALEAALTYIEELEARLERADYLVAAALNGSSAEFWNPKARAYLATTEVSDD